MTVRNESVRLTLDDAGFSTGMVRAAAATEVLSNRLDGLNGHLSQTVTHYNNLNQNNSGLNQFNNRLVQGGNQLDRYSGRLRLWAEALAAIGPGLIPIGAVAIPAITGLASQLGFAAAAGGTAILAFQGVGDALDTLNKARLEPTTENLEAAQLALENLSPAAREFVTQLRSMSGAGKQLRFAAQEGLFPGLTRALDTIETRVPDAARILLTLGDAAGDLAAKGAASLAGDEWDEFFKFIETDARESLVDLGNAVGNTVHALAELWMAFDPLNDDFSNWMVDATEALDDWASGLAETEGFSEFVAYIRDNGPQVAATFKAIATAALDIVQAAAPLGGPVLQALEGIARAISLIADSDMGTPILTALAALTLFNRAMAVQSRIAATAWGRNVSGANGFYASLRAVNRAALVGGAALGAFALYQSGVVQQANLTNTAMLALAGTMIGGPWGAAMGAGVGLTMDLAAANDNLEAAVSRAKLSMEQGAGPEVLRRDLQALNRELEETEKRMEFKDTSLLDLWNPVGYTADQVHNLMALGDRVQNKFSDLGDEAERTKKSLEEALTPRPAGLDPLADALGITQQALEATTQSIDQFAASFERLNGILTNRANLRDYQAALDALRASLKENGQTFSEFTDKGRENLENLDAVATTAIRRANGLKEAGRDLQAVRVLQVAIKDIQRFADTSPKAKEAASGILAELKRLAAQKTEPKVKVDPKQAEGEIASLKGLLGGLDKTTANPKIRVDSGDAAGAIASIRAQLASIPREIRTTYYVNQINSISRNQAAIDAQPYNAIGGMWRDGIRTYARGGMDRANRHEPEMSRPTLRIWAEPETGGESYIPHANDHRRPRAKEILSRTADMFGGRVQWFENGDLIANPARGSRRSAAERAFNIGSLGVAETREELREFARAVREAGGHLDKSFSHLSKRAVALSRQYEKSENRLEALRSRAADVRSAARSAFDNDPFGGSLSDFRTQVNADRNDARATTAALGKAGRKGLDGRLAELLAASGNRLLAEQFAGLSRAQIAREERRFAQREVALSGLGEAAVDVSGLSKSIAAEARELRQLTKRLNNIEKRIENAVRTGAREGTSGQKKERDRLVAAAVRGGGR